MAKNLLEKLNTLLQANLNNLTPDLSRLKPGKNLGREVEALKKQLKVAQEDAAKIEAQLAALTERILKWDVEADAALKVGKEALARHALQQMEIEKRRLVMLQAELDEHHQSMAGLMRQLNHFEGILQAAQQIQTEAEEETETLSEAIRRAREMAQAELENEPSLSTLVSDANDTEVIEREIAQRRSRLAKPDA